MNIDRKDALRYMGVHGDVPDAALDAVIDECEAELLRAAEPRFVYRVFDVERGGDSLRLAGCGFELLGNDIRRHLDGCDKAAVAAVTLSAGTDRFLKRQMLRGGLYGLASDALASAYAESVSAALIAELSENTPGYSPNWCFAAGYGDLPLELLPKLLECTDAVRKTGVSCTAANMLSPQKSIVGIIGLSRGGASESGKSCASCGMSARCSYRKNGGHC